MNVISHSNKELNEPDIQSRGWKGLRPLETINSNYFISIIVSIFCFLFAIWIGYFPEYLPSNIRVNDSPFTRYLVTSISAVLAIGIPFRIFVYAEKVMIYETGFFYKVGVHKEFYRWELVKDYNILERTFYRNFQKKKMVTHLQLEFLEPKTGEVVSKFINVYGVSPSYLRRRLMYFHKKFSESNELKS